MPLASHAPSLARVAELHELATCADQLASAQNPSRGEDVRAVVLTHVDAEGADALIHKWHVEWMHGPALDDHDAAWFVLMRTAVNERREREARL